MRFSVAVALPAIAAAAPSILPNLACLKEGFSVGQVANPGYKGANFGCVYRLALEKYNAPNKTAVTKHTNNQKSGSVTAAPTEYDAEYLTPITIGSTKAKLQIDTGSSDLWVFGPGTEGEGTHNIYEPKVAPEAGESWSISYGDGSSARGKVYPDKVVIGPVSVTSQAVEAATSVSNEFVLDSGDGIVGLGFDSVNQAVPKKVKTFVQNAVAQGMKDVFAADLKYHQAGTYDFGLIDSSKYKGSLAYTAVDKSQGFWMFTPQHITIGAIQPTVMDTGTSLMLLSDEAVEAYYKKVPGAQNSASAGGWIFPCTATLPSVTVTIGGYKATVPGKYINYQNAGGLNCYGGIQSSGGLGFDVYGDVFIKSQYVVFQGSTTTPRIGIAAKK